MINNLRILCVVPARGGSKSIPRKNLQKVAGLSLVGRAGLVASQIPIIDRSIVSTDDTEIAIEGQKHGLECPFIRPESLSGDFATSLDMWKHAWLSAEQTYNEQYDISLLLEPTSPMREVADVLRTLNKVITGSCSAITVSRTPSHFTPEKTLCIKNEKLEYYLGDRGRNFHIRQNIPHYYHRNGICYALTRKHLIDDNSIFENADPIVIERPIVNIDEYYELDLANILLSDK